MARSFNRMIENVRALSDSAEAIGKGNYDTPVPVRGPDDVLGVALSRMKENLRAARTMDAEQKKALRQEKEKLELKIGLYEELSGELKQLQKTLTSLKPPSEYNKKTAVFSVLSPAGAKAESILTATPTSEAVIQEWDLDVLNTATAERRISNYCSSAATAPAGGSGPRAKAGAPPFHISCAAAASTVGRPWPPCSTGPGSAFQPASHQSR